MRVGGGGRTTNVHCLELVLPVWAGNVSGIGSPLSPSLTNSLNSYLLRKLISISYLPRGRVKCTYVEGGFPRQGIVVIQVINGYNNVTIILSFGSDRMSAIPVQYNWHCLIFAIHCQVSNPQARATELVMVSMIQSNHSKWCLRKMIKHKKHLMGSIDASQRSGFLVSSLSC